MFNIYISQQHFQMSAICRSAKATAWLRCEWSLVQALALGPRQSDYCVIMYIKNLKRYIFLEL